MSSQSSRFTEKQGQYLAFIHTYALLNRRAPAEADFQRFFCVSAPSVHQMIVQLDGTALYFAPTNGVPQQIFVAHRVDETHNFDAGTELMELADPDGGGTADPAISPDQKLIIVSSGRTGSPGFVNLWYATRANVTDAFGPLQLVPDISSTHYDGDAFLSHDGCRVYFASTRNNPGAGDWDLFVAQQQL